MRIKINDNAAQHYTARCYKHAHPECGMLHSPEFAKMLKAVQGKWLEVETDYLFRDQFNIGPIEGVSEQGMRIMIESVVEIEDDVRIGVIKCNWCGAHGKGRAWTQSCSKCKKRGYLKPLNPIGRHHD